MTERVNIPRKIQDENYRYKMDVLQTRVEGKGINVRTVLPNLKDVARDLRLAPIYILKFMGYELGSNVILREKANDERAQINGTFNRNDILNTLDKFIDKFILCEQCKYPETVLVVYRCNRDTMIPETRTDNCSPHV